MDFKLSAQFFGL